MIKTLLLSAAALSITAGAATAQDGKWNLGAGYTYFDADAVELDVLNIRGGYDFTEYLGVEGELLVGLQDEDITIAGVTGDVSLDYGVGIFGKAQYPLTEQLSVFGRVGYVVHEVEAEVAGVEDSDDEDGFAFGAGAEWAFSGPNAIRFDYTRYDYDGGGDADAWSIGYVRRF